MSTYCVSVQWYSVSKEFPRNLIQSPLCPWPTTKRGYRKVILGYCCHLMLRVPQHLFQYFTKNFTGGLGYTKTHLFLSLDFPLTSVTSIIFFNESSAQHWCFYFLCNSSSLQAACFRLTFCSSQEEHGRARVTEVNKNNKTHKYSETESIIYFLLDPFQFAYRPNRGVEDAVFW